MKSAGNEKIVIGKILSTHGVRGCLKLQPLSYSDSRFDTLGEVYLVSKSGTELKVTHLSTRSVPGKWLLLCFEELDSPDKARAFVGGTLQVPQDETISLPEDTYFHYQLIGMKVIDLQGGDIGSIFSVMELGANDVYVVQKGEKQYMIPAIYDVVKKVDLENNTMTIDPLEGLLE